MHDTRLGGQATDDRATSPIFAAVLMILITIVASATAYAWVTVFTGERTTAEKAAVGVDEADLDGDGKAEWIELELVQGENAPYAAEDVSITVTDPTGSVETLVCQTPRNPACGGTADAFRASEGDTWDVPGMLWIPCQALGDHLVTVSVLDTTVADRSVDCEALV